MGLTRTGVDQMNSSGTVDAGMVAERVGVPGGGSLWLEDRCSCRPGGGRGHQIQRNASAGAEDTLGHSQDLGGKLGLAQLRDRLVDVILDPAEKDLAIFNEGIRGAGISISGLPHAAGIDDLQSRKSDVHGGVGMADTQEIGRQMGGPHLPDRRILAEILIQRIARRGMHQGESHSVEFHRGLDGKPREESQLPGIQPIPLEGTGAGHELAEPPTWSWGHALGDVVIVIAADGRPRMVADPIHTGSGIHSVIDQIACEQARVKRLLDGPQSRPVGVNVSQEQDSQGEQPERIRNSRRTVQKRGSPLDRAGRHHI